MRVLGQVATSSASRVPVETPTYTEQTTGAQRSLKSASANDAVAGSGVQKVRVVYFVFTDANGNIAGPFSEIVSMAGTVAAPMVATNVALIERIEAVQVGAGGVAAGDISLYAAADGTGTVIGKIPSGGLYTQWAHHYVATGSQCRVTDAEVSGGDAAQALFEVVAENLLTKIETPIANATNNNGGSKQVVFPDKGPISGPARVRVMVTPANTNSQTSTVAIGVTGEKVVLA